MDRIELKFQQLKEIGRNGLILFFKGTANIGDVAKGNIAPMTWTSCFTGGDYLQHEFGVPNSRLGVYDNSIDDVNSLYAVMSSWKGLYHLQFSGFEDHKFTIYIKDNEIILGNSYGGIRNLVIKKYNRSHWLNLFDSAMKGNIDDYAKVFDVPRSNITIRKVGFRLLEYKHDSNPKFLVYDNPGVDLREYFSFVWDPVFELTDKQLEDENFTPGEIKDIRAEQSNYISTCNW